MFCCFCGCRMETSFIFCPSCGKKKIDGNSEASTATSSSSEMAMLLNSSQAKTAPSNVKSTVSDYSLSAFMKKKEAERRSHFEPKRKKTRATATPKNTEVLITIGLMEYDHTASDNPRRVFGKTFPVKVTPDMTYDQVLEKSLTKWENYDRTFCRERGYVLVYPDGKLARTIPGSSDEFIMGKYKEELGKPYSRINMYLCPAAPKEKERGSETLITDLLDRREVNDVELQEMTEMPEFGGDSNDILGEANDSSEGNETEDGDFTFYAVTDFL